MSNTTGECTPGLNCNNGNEENCCRSKVICKKPGCLNDICSECIFVEKIFNSSITKRQLEFGFPVEINIQRGDIVSIETISVECNLLSFETTIINVNINDEFIDISTTVPGPGGTQIVLNNEQINQIRDNNCTKVGKGTKVQLDILVGLQVVFDLIVTGTGIDNNGQLVPFTGSVQVATTLRFTISFNDFCIPPLALCPISFITSCLTSCTYKLFSFEFTPNSFTILINGQLIFCTTCETIFKVPSEICALTTGPCIIKKSKAFCDDDDFPNKNTPSP